MGTPEFAVPTLLQLNEKYNVKAVVTVPDKPKGRGLKLLPSAVKTAALDLGLPVLQPTSLKDEQFVSAIEAIAPDIIVVIAFRILPEAVYSLAKIASFNIHGSLLPRYRGPAPINHAILNGDKETGLTSFVLRKSVDTGDILLQAKCPIADSDTFGDLYDKMKMLAPDLALQTVDLLNEGGYSVLTQDETLATSAPKIFSENCRIDWNKSAEEVKNLINGVSPTPGAWSMLDTSRIKILRAEAEKSATDAGTGGNVAGSFRTDNSGFFVNCGSGRISIKELQFPGKKAQTIKVFLNGWRGDKSGKFE